ncbi:hypothetical protein [Paraglaciecola arctica]|uniref:Uncharacterized protein n=1 Tax=Paraglaciecola arctica BSs20135 TaxID=493475 RepID=K6Y875_9ALTE|nr:hypothetical protein [Paraglaciecola arctica]GAC20156.1 hypothetical protein GARC_3197 [Paraglaciecola arctica BSs20135]
MREQNIVYSLAWFQPNEWSRLKEVVDDPSSLDDTYEEWRANAEKAISKYRANGQTVQKISIKISELLIWCGSKGYKPDSEARAEYTASLAKERNK